MSDELKEAMRVVMEHLDEIMIERPDRKAADAYNYLADLLDAEDEDA